MLVLSRKVGQRIVIADNITIEVLHIRGNTVRLGIEAPVDVRVLRGELVPDDTNPSPGRIELDVELPPDQEKAA